MSTITIEPAPTSFEPLLPPAMHPFSDLLRLSPAAIHQRYAHQQHLEFFDTVEQLFQQRADPLAALPLMRALRDVPGVDDIRQRLDRAALCATFERLHRHVLGHPVWLHPFFVRFADGAMSRAEMTRFLRQYLNQIKNTRQCVALALGRLNSLSLPARGLIAERVSEQTQVVLAGILADEYGVAARPTGLDGSDAPAGDMFDAVTHVELYRRMFELVDVRLDEQDEPMLPATADNVLIQRIVSGDPRFDQLEALASVGMAMEWGVPVFFSLLLRGVLRFADRQGIAVDAHQLEVLTGHVRQDVEHAVGVMLVAALWVEHPGDVDRIIAAANTVMAGRHAMMSEMHAHVFGQAAPHMDEMPIDECYRLTDRRVVASLRAARAAVVPGWVAGGDYVDAPMRLPFVADPRQAEDAR